MKVQETAVCPVGDRWDTRVYTEERPVAAREKREKREKRKRGKEKRGRKGEGKKKKEKSRCWVGAWKGRRRARRRGRGYPGRWAPRYNTRLPLPAAISVNCSVPDKKNVGKIKFSSVIHHEATDSGRADSTPIGWLRPAGLT